MARNLMTVNEAMKMSQRNIVAFVDALSNGDTSAATDIMKALSVPDEKIAAIIEKIAGKELVTA